MPSSKKRKDSGKKSHRNTVNSDNELSEDERSMQFGEDTMNNNNSRKRGNSQKRERKSKRVRPSAAADNLHVALADGDEIEQMGTAENLNRVVVEINPNPDDNDLVDLMEVNANKDDFLDEDEPQEEGEIETVVQPIDMPTEHLDLQQNFQHESGQQEANGHRLETAASQRKGNDVVTFSQLATFFEANGLLRTSQKEPERLEKRKRHENRRRGEIILDNNNNCLDASSSTMTIYRQAIMPKSILNQGEKNSPMKELMEKCFSSSSDEGGVNFSDEIEYDDGEITFRSNNPLVDQIADNGRDKNSDQRQDRCFTMMQETAQPSTSRDERFSRYRLERQQVRLPPPPPMLDERRRSRGEIIAECMIREAEESKARIYGLPGNDCYAVTDEKIDDDFLVVAAHVDPTTCDKIVKGEYVDFAKLIPRDRIASEDDHRMEMVNRGGHSYWVPVADREKTDISSIFRWDQAF